MSWPEKLQVQYQRVLVLDGDDDIFERVIQRKSSLLNIRDIDDLETTSTSTGERKLRSLGIFINSAITDLISRAETFLEDRQTVLERRKKVLAHPTLDTIKDLEAEFSNTESNVIEEQTATEKNELEQTDDATSKVPKVRESSSLEKEGSKEGVGGSQADAIAPKLYQAAAAKESAIPSRTLKDDRNGEDYVGYTEYAKVLAALIVFKAGHPYVVGILGQWGSGKSTIMTLMADFIKYFVILDIVSRYIEKQKAIHREAINNKEERIACIDDAQRCMDWIKTEFVKDHKFIQAIDMWMKLGFDNFKYDELMEGIEDFDRDEVQNLIDGRCPPFMWYLELFSLLNSVFGLLSKMVESVMERFFPTDDYRAVLKRCILDRHNVRLETKERRDKKKMSSVSLCFRKMLNYLCGGNLAGRVAKGMDFVAQW